MVIVIVIYQPVLSLVVNLHLKLTMMIICHKTWILMIIHKLLDFIVEHTRDKKKNE